MEQNQLVEKAARLLESLDIPYAVTGGIALAIWAKPRFTADIDIAIELLPRKLEQLADELSKLGQSVYLDKQVMQEALERRSEFNLIDPESGLKIDFWVLPDEPFARQQLKRRIKKTINGTDVYFISPEDLILRKLEWYKDGQSQRQLEDVKAILAVQTNLDYNYLKDWASRQSTLDILNPLI